MISIFMGWVVSLAVAVVAVAGGILNEWYKHHRSRLGVAAVIRAEIEAICQVTVAAGTVQRFEQIAAAIEANQAVTFPKVYTPEPSYGPIYEHHVERFGLLSSSDAERIVRFYNYLIGIRTITRNLTNGAYDGLPNSQSIVAAQIRVGLGFWHECEQIIPSLVLSLERVTKEKFLGLFP